MNYSITVITKKIDKLAKRNERIFNKPHDITENQKREILRNELLIEELRQGLSILKENGARK